MSIWDSVSDERRRHIRAGAAAAARLAKDENIHIWREFGVGACDLRAIAMEQAGTNKATGTAYNNAWRRLVESDKDARDIANFPTPGRDNSGPRAHAMWLAEKWETIDAWLHSLDDHVRLRMSHPTTIRRAYDAAILKQGREAAAAAAEARGEIPPVKAATPRQELQDQLTRALEKIDLYEKKGGRGLMAYATPEQLVDELFNANSVAFVRRLIQLATKRVDDEERFDRTAKERQAKAKRKPKAKETKQPAAITPMAKERQTKAKRKPAEAKETKQPGRHLADGTADVRQP